jgi:acyl dehydratase
MTTTVANPAGLLELVGADLGPTASEEIDAMRVDQFRDATRAGAKTLGTTDDDTVPPLMLLSLVNLFLPELLTVETFSAGLNIGLDGVGFPAPAPVGMPIRARGEVLAAEELKGGVQVTVRVTIELAGSDGTSDAVCVADTVSRFLP